MPSKNNKSNKNGKGKPANKPAPKKAEETSPPRPKPSRKPKIPPHPEKLKPKAGPKLPPRPTGAKTTTASAKPRPKIPPRPTAAAAQDKAAYTKVEVAKAKVGDVAVSPRPAERAKPNPLYLLDLDLGILRHIRDGAPRPALTSCPREDLLKWVKDEALLSERLKHLKGMKLIVNTKEEGVRWAYKLTMRGFNLAGDAMDSKVRVNTKELLALVEAIQADLDIIAGTGATIVQALLKRLEHYHALGTKLRRVKATLPHGVWLMVLRYCFSWKSERQVERYIKYSYSTFTSDLKVEQDKWRKICNNKSAAEKKAKQAEEQGEAATVNLAEITPTEAPDGDDTTAEDVEAEAAAQATDAQPSMSQDETQDDGGKTKRKAKSRKGEADVVTLTVRVPVKAANRWSQIMEYAKKRFNVDSDSRATLCMAEDWMTRVGREEAESQGDA
jgi:hypothetical protein